MGSVAQVIVPTLLVVTLLGAIVVTARNRLRVAAQVSARHPNDAPLWWVVAPTPAAILHRRLRTAVTTMHAAVPQPRRRRAEVTRVQSMAADIEQLAASADREVILASRSPRGGRLRRLSEVSRLVVTVEDSVGRVVAVAAELDPSRHAPKDWDEKLRELDIRLRAHEAALADLARFDVTVETTARDSTG